MPIQLECNISNNKTKKPHGSLCTKKLFNCTVLHIKDYRKGHLLSSLCLVTEQGLPPPISSFWLEREICYKSNEMEFYKKSWQLCCKKQLSILTLIECGKFSVMFVCFHLVWGECLWIKLVLFLDPLNRLENYSRLSMWVITDMPHGSLNITQKQNSKVKSGIQPPPHKKKQLQHTTGIWLLIQDNALCHNPVILHLMCDIAHL